MARPERDSGFSSEIPGSPASSLCSIPASSNTLSRRNAVSNHRNLWRNNRSAPTMGWFLITPRDSFPGFFPALITWISPPWLGGVEGARIYPSGGNPAPTGGIFLPKIPRGAALEQPQPIPSLWIGTGLGPGGFPPDPASRGARSRLLQRSQYPTGSGLVWMLSRGLCVLRIPQFMENHVDMGALTFPGASPAYPAALGVGRGRGGGLGGAALQMRRR